MNLTRVKKTVSFVLAILFIVNALIFSQNANVHADTNVDCDESLNLHSDYLTPTPTTIPTAAITPIQSTESATVYDFVNRVFTEMLCREGTEEEVNHMAYNILDNYYSCYAVVRSYALSAEFQSRELSNNEYINTLCRVFYNRNASQEEIDTYTDYLNSSMYRDSLIVQIINTDEWINACQIMNIRPGNDWTYDPIYPTSILTSTPTPMPTSTSTPTPTPLVTDCVYCMDFQHLGCPLMDQVLLTGDINNDGHVSIEECEALTSYTIDTATLDVYAPQLGTYIEQYFPNLVEMTVIEDAFSNTGTGIYNIPNIQTLNIDVTAHDINNRHFISITNCPDLKTININDNYASNYTFLIGTLPSLDTMNIPAAIGDLYLSLWDLPLLASVDGNDSYTGLMYFRNNCPLLGKDYTQAPDPSVIAPNFTDAKRTGVEGFIERLYDLALERPIDQSGFDYWCSSVRQGGKTGADLAMGFMFGPEFLGKPRTNEEYVSVLYEIFFDRASDSSGMAFWLDLMSQGTSKTELVFMFINTPEWVQICNSYGIKSGASSDVVPQNDLELFIERLYLLALGRESDIGGMNSWMNAIANGATGADIATGFLYSPEFLGQSRTNDEFISILYKIFFDREADPAGLGYWMGYMAGGASKIQVIISFINSTEWADVCESYGIPSGGTGIPSSQL